MKKKKFLSQVPDQTELAPVLITRETIQDFLDYLKKKNRSEATIRKYALDLRSFFNSLSEDKLLTSESLVKWRAALISAGFAPRTVNTRVAACNSFATFLGREYWQVAPVPLAEIETSAPLSRETYYQLLKAARAAGNEWIYYLIKVFCCLGLSVSELHLLTVDALVAGQVTVASKPKARIIRIPEILRVELINYAFRCNINSGSLFKSPEGYPLTRTLIIKEIGALCEAAGLSGAEITPKDLRMLYYNTYSDIRSSSSLLIEKEYASILENEDSIIGWDNIAV